MRTIEALLGAEYSHCNSDGSNPSKEQWVSWFRTRAADIDGPGCGSSSSHLA